MQESTDVSVTERTNDARARIVTRLQGLVMAVPEEEQEVGNHPEFQAGLRSMRDHANEQADACFSSLTRSCAHAETPQIARFYTASVLGQYELALGSLGQALAINRTRYGGNREQMYVQLAQAFQASIRPILEHDPEARAQADRPAETPGVFDPRAFEHAATHKDNLAFNLYRELMYWNNELLAGSNPYIAERLNLETAGARQCPHILLGQVEREAERLGRKPRVLDFGSGPLSTLIYVHRSGLADVVAFDALSSEYSRLLGDHDIDWPLIPQRAAGEFVTEQHPEAEFDIVFVSNALDHTQCPALTWQNLFDVTALGGVLIHVHAVCEATHENYDQLHQFDLFPKGDSMWITDATGHEFSLTDDLPLECIESDLTGRPEHEWFSAAYRKVGHESDSLAWSRHLLKQLKRAFRKRNNWAFTLERLIGESVDLRARFNGLPFYVEHPEA